jgi:hypothetical protein
MSPDHSAIRAYVSSLRPIYSANHGERPLRIAAGVLAEPSRALQLRMGRKASLASRKRRFGCSGSLLRDGSHSRLFAVPEPSVLFRGGPQSCELWLSQLSKRGSGLAPRSARQRGAAARLRWQRLNQRSPQRFSGEARKVSTRPNELSVLPSRCGSLCDR